MKKKLLLIVTFAIVLIAISISCSKSKIEIRLNLQEGQRFMMLYHTDMKMTQKFMGMPIEMDMKMDMDLEFENTGQDNDSNYLMTVTYQAIKYQMKAQGQLISFSTENSSADTLMDKVFSNIKGKSFDMKINKSGKIIEISKLDSLSAYLFGNMSDSSRMKEFSELFNKNFGEESIRNNFGIFFGFYPENPVSVGDKWMNTTAVKSFFALTIENNYQLTSDKNDLYEINIQSNMKTDAKDEQVEIKGMQMKFNMKGTQTGSIKIDQKTAWISDSEIKQKITGDAIISKPGLTGGGNFAIPYTMESTTKISLKK